MTTTPKATRTTLLAVIATALVAFAGILSETSMNVTFSKLMTVFNTDLGTLQWITTGYLLAVAISITLGATLSHNWTERRILFTSLFFFTLGNLVAALAPNFFVLMVGRLLQGGSTGIAIPLLFNLIVERVPRQQIGLFMGLAGLVISLAPAIGPTYGGFMIGLFDWHMIFFFILPVPVISFILGYFFLKNGKPKTKRPFDFPSFLLLATALTSFILTISSLEEGGINLPYLVLFAVTLGLFIWRSLTIKHPYLEIRLLARPVILLGIIPFLIYQFANLSSNFIIPNYLTLVTGTSTAQAGFSLLPGTLLGALTAPLMGKLYDTKGPKLSLYTGNALFFIAVLLFTVLTKQLTVGLIITIYILFSFGRNLAFNNTMALSVSQVERNETPDATAIFQMAQTFAGALGTDIAAILVKQAPDTTSGVHHVFLLLTILVGIIFVLFASLFKKIKKA